MAGQTTYNLTRAVGFPGLIYDMRNITVESYACESATIAFGSAVAPGTDPDKQVKKPTATSQGFRGVALHEYGHAQDSDGNATYVQYDAVSVLRKGTVWVRVVSTVADNATAYYIATGANAGLFDDVAGEATSSATSRAGIFRKATTAASGLAVLEIDL